MKLLEIVARVQELTDGKPYAVIGGLAQILWARKTHTDDLDIALAATDLSDAVEGVRAGSCPEGWALPTLPDRPTEAEDVIEVAHLLYEGSVVDLIAFRNEAFNAEVIATARPVPELQGIRFVRPELLLVTHLLRPGPRGALAAVELVLAREEHGGLDIAQAQRWADALGQSDRLTKTLQRAKAFSLE